MTPQQRENLVTALVKSFDKASFRTMLINKLGIVLEDEVDTATGFRFIVDQLVSVSEKGEWTNKLIFAAYEAIPVTRIKDVIDELQINMPMPAGEAEKGLVVNTSEVVELPKLEKIVNKRASLTNFTDYLKKLRCIGSQICRIEFPEGKPRGTGWLVAPNLVLTNYHVIEDVYKHIYDSSDVVCRFDYFDSSNLNEQKINKLPIDWLVDYSPYSQSDLGISNVDPTPDELDYALLKLDGQPGNDMLPNGEVRNWIPLSENPVTIMPEDIVLIPQHPQGRSLELAFGNVLKDGAFNSNGTRLRYNANTDEGSSGSPCFNINLAPFGLHHSGKEGKYNECVPLREVIKKMKRENKVSQFWTNG